MIKEDISCEYIMHNVSHRPPTEPPWFRPSSGQHDEHLRVLREKRGRAPA